MQDLENIVRIYWATALPNECAALSDPEGFFAAKATDIREQVAAEVYAGEDPDGALERALGQFLPVSSEPLAGPRAIQEARATDFWDGFVRYEYEKALGLRALALAQAEEHPTEAAEAASFERIRERLRAEDQGAPAAPSAGLHR